MIGPWLGLLALAAPTPTFTAGPPAEVALLVLAPSELPGALSLSEITEVAFERLREATILRPRTTSQLGLLDERFRACPQARVFACWADLVSSTEAPPTILWVLTLTRDGPHLAARSIWMPLADTRAAQDPLAHATVGAWHRLENETQLATIITRFLGEARPLLAVHQRSRFGTLTVAGIPVGAEIRLDDAVVVPRAPSTEIDVVDVPLGLHRLIVRDGEGVDDAKIELEGPTLTIDLWTSRLSDAPPSMPLLIGGGALTALGTAGLVWAAIEAERSGQAVCLISAPEDTCSSLPVRIGAGDSVGRFEDSGFPIVAPAAGTLASGVTALGLALFLETPCRREPVWCGLASGAVGLLVGGTLAVTQ